MTTIAILDPFSGIAGDMTLGALLDLGLEAEWLRTLPAVLGLEGVELQSTRVLRGEIASWKVELTIPPQPHGRHFRHICAIVEGSSAPARVKERAIAAFEAISRIEAQIHGSTMERVHLHEVGSVDAIIDIVGSVWGFDLLNVERIYCTTIALGDGFVDATHGRIAVPAPATLRLLEGQAVSPGPEGSGELTTPTGAALVRVLSNGAPPATFRPLKSGYGAGTRNPVGRANVLRIILADADLDQDISERLDLLVADIDDMTGEYLAAAAESARDAGALDVTLVPTLMKKGRPGVRIELLCRPADVARLEGLLLRESSAIGVRRMSVSRRALPRASSTIHVFGEPVRVKSVTLPDGTMRSKPEFEDVRRLAQLTGRTAHEILHAVTRAE